MGIARLFVAILLAFAWIPVRASALQIDSFETSQSVFGSLDGEEQSDMILFPTGAIPSGRIVAVRSQRDGEAGVVIGAGSLEFRFAHADSGGGAVVNWQLPAPIDLTEGGSMTRLVFDVMDVDLEGRLFVGLGHGGGGWAVVVPLSGAGSYEVLMSDFLFVDPTAIDMISIGFRQEGSTTGGSVRIGGPFSTVPEPGLAIALCIGSILLLSARFTRACARST